MKQLSEIISANSHNYLVLDDWRDVIKQQLPAFQIQGVGRVLTKNDLLAALHVATRDLANANTVLVEMERQPLTESIDTFLNYMWNPWGQDECKRVFQDVRCGWEHIWNKWERADGTIDRFYAGLDKENRELLVKRALEYYGKTKINQTKNDYVQD